MSDLQTLISTLRKDRVQLWVSDGELRCRGPATALDPERLSDIRRHKQEIIDFLQQPPVTRNSSLSTGTRPTVLPLSYGQEGLWFLDQLNIAGPAYNQRIIYRLEGELTEGLLEQSLHDVVERHEILRTRYWAVEGVAVQVIDPPTRANIETTDLSGLETGEQSERMRQLFESHAHYHFDLEKESPFKAHLIRLAQAKHCLILNMHHIVVDGPSVAILLRELSVLYEAHLHGQESPLRPLLAQYADYAVWQRRWMQSEVFQEYLAHWKARLAGLQGTLDLPVDRTPPVVQSFEGGVAEFDLAHHTVVSLRALAGRQDVTLYILLLAIFQILLSRWTGGKEVVVGSPVDVRHWQAEQLIGYFLNTVVLRADLSGNPTFSDFLGKVKACVLDAYEHRDMPFDRLVAELRPARNGSQQPLFRVAYSYLAQEEWKLFGLQTYSVPPDDHTAKFDLSLFISETSTTLIKGGFEYATDLFDKETIERLIVAFQRLVEGLVANPEVRIGEVTLLSGAERRRLLEEWNDTGVEFGRERCIHELFEEQASNNGKATAVVCEGEELSYEELNARANQLAHYLRRLGVGPDQLVGICLERTPGMVVALLGILKAGGAYVPLDPNYPLDRLAFMLADSGSAVLVSERKFKQSLPPHGARLVCVDEEGTAIGQEPRTNPDNQSQPLNLAYCLYTSGSTGQPKGVTLQHGNASWFLNWAGMAFRTQHLARVMGTTSINFDLSIFELFVPLVNGGSVVLVKDVLSAGTPGLAPTLLNTVPSAAQALLEAQAFPDSVRIVNLAGEPLPAALVTQLHDRVPEAQIYNLYGPTECTTYSTACEVTGEVEGRVSIGRPLANTQIYILDEEQEPVPVGVTGEIYIAGSGLARGYVNRPELTAEKFVPRPFGPSGGRMYRTGDLGRYLPDGRIDFVGRNDHQVKIRGYRIELGEIEAALRSCPEVREAVVLVRQDTPGDRRLVAYVAGQEEELESVQERLRQKLPDYMVPRRFVFLEALPRGPNGKIDRHGLTEPETCSVSSGVEYVAPRTPTELQLAGIWTEVLQVERVGVHDDFFALGGHSLLVTQVAVRIRQALGIEILLRDLFRVPTLIQLSQYLDSLLNQRASQLPVVASTKSQRVTTGNRHEAIPRAPRTFPVKASFAQEQLWFLDQFEPGTSVYNMPTVWRITGELDLAVLERAFNEVVRRHEILRTTFAARDGFPVQIIADRWHLPVTTSDLSIFPDAEARAQVLIEEEDQRSFDLAKGPLIRASLIHLRKDQHILLVTMHHAISDGWSMATMFRELSVIYDAFHLGQASPLPDLPIQYADFAVWQRHYLSGEVLEELLTFWKCYLSGLPKIVDLPFDRPRPLLPSRRGAEAQFELSSELTTALRAISRRCQATLFMTMAAAFNVLLYRYSGQSEICIGYPVGTRSRVELERLIGQFVNVLVLRTRLSRQQTFKMLLSQVRESILDADAHKDLPFEKLVEELRPERDLSHQPLFQVSYNFSNTHVSGSGATPSFRGTAGGGLRLSGLRVHQVQSEERTAKFDLNLFVSDTVERLECSFDYATDLFDKETIERLIVAFQRLVEGLVANPEVRIGEVTLLSGAERRRLLEEWNDTGVEFGRERCIHELFEEQASNNGKATAVVCEGEELSYEELNARANQLAHYLRRLGVGPDQLVGICLERTPGMVVALLGILKAGGAYVPLDPNYPLDRLAFMLADSGSAVLVSERKFKQSLPPHGARLVCVDEEGTAIGQEPRTNPDNQSQPLNLAYCLYTSGSTGQPKGVTLQHGNASWFLNWAGMAFRTQHLARVMGTTSINFDLSIFELFVPLVNGGSVVLVKDVLSAGTPGLAPTLLNTVPSAAQALLEAQAFPDSVRIVNLAGEPLPAALVTQLHDRVPEAQIYNLYGPTECTTYSTACEVTGEVEGRVSIGRPLANTQIYILDEEQEPVPVGVTGEIYIAGSGLARGYVNRPELTAEKFVPRPFGPSGGRMYRTGDLGRYLPDGRIDFVGRNDHQVKIRGYRIELGEIEAALRSCPEVREAVVLVRQDTPGDRRLVAYVAPENLGALETSTLRAQLERHLPKYMMPETFVLLKSLPRGPNGKIDQNALPAPGARGSSSADYVAPRTATEELLVGIWMEVLKVQRIGIHDDFFSLGGHSLLATKVATRIAGAKSVSLPIREVFLHPTVVDLAIYLDNNIDRLLQGEKPKAAIPKLNREVLQS